tara:strand:- start:217 stop:465 length:249 start_codon:yes stop_codon:yes gene_type:complete
MKVIAETSTKLAKYALTDDETIVSTADNLQIGNPIKFLVDDLNSTTVTITENVTNVPDDWVGNKYTFDGTTWTLNPNWVDPD